MVITKTAAIGAAITTVLTLLPGDVVVAQACGTITTSSGLSGSVEHACREYVTIQYCPLSIMVIDVISDYLVSYRSHTQC